MSSCSRRYASKSVARLNQLCLQSAALPPPEAAQPLLFLYPTWFRHELSRQYHTELAPGQDRRRGCSLRTESSRPAAPPPRLRSVGRRQLCTIHVLQSKDSTASQRSGIHATSKANSKKTTASDPPSRTSLAVGLLIRKYNVDVVPTRKVVKDFESESTSTIHYRRSVDAERIFATLKTIDPDPKQVNSNATRLSLAAHVVHGLLGTKGSNMWIHHDGSGCLVRVEPVSGSERYDVELEGSDRAKELARGFLLGAVPSGLLSEDAEWSQAIQSCASSVRHDEIPRPLRWTLSSFHKYVHIITHTKSLRGAMQYVHGNPVTHNQDVGMKLETLFTNPMTTPFVTTKAMRKALRFCRLHTELAPIAKHIWDACTKLGLQPDIFCFNEELSRCLVSKDWKRFTSLVLDLSDRGLRPNGQTWVLALRYADHPSVRWRMLYFLKETQLFKSSRDREHIANAILKKEASSSLQKRRSIRDLIEHMNSHFGDQWLSTASIWRLLRACRVKRADSATASDVLAVVRQVDSSQCVLDEACLVELVRIARKAGNLMDALDVVKSEAMLQVSKLGQEMLESLFLLSWSKRRYNLCRLLWFQAATSGLITFEMQKLVQNSLKTNTSNEADQRLRVWLLLAGKVIIGTNLELNSFPTLFPHLTQMGSGLSSVQYLLQWTANDEEFRHEQMQLCHLLMERDLNAWRFYRKIPFHEFLQLLDIAITLDDNWNTNFDSEKTIPWELVTRSIKINLERRSDPVSADVSEDSVSYRTAFVVNKHELDYTTLDLDDDMTDGTTAGEAREAQALFARVSNPHTPIAPVPLDSELNELRKDAREFTPMVQTDRARQQTRFRLRTDDSEILPEEARIRAFA